MNDHLRPVGKPAPPRPRKPDSFTSLMIHSLPFSRMRLVPFHAPRRRAFSSRQPCSPYRFLKMRSRSCSMRLGVPRGIAYRMFGRARIADVCRRAGFLCTGIGELRLFPRPSWALGIELRIGKRGRAADRGRELPLDLRPRLWLFASRKVVENIVQTL